MKRWVAKLIAPRRMELFEGEIPEPVRTQVLVRVVSSGLCHSEMPFFEGWRRPPPEDGSPLEPSAILADGTLDYPFTLGHEPTGIVEAVGPEVTSLRVGDRVTGVGWIDGCDSFASLVLIREENLVQVPAGVPLEYALGEPLGCVANIARIASPGFGDNVAVVGCGFMGLLVVAALARTPLRHLIAVDLIAERLAWAREFGATTTLNPGEADVAAEVRALTGGRGVDVAVEITGRAAGLELATTIVREHRAKVLLASVYRQEPFNIGDNLMRYAPTLVAAHPVYSEDKIEDVRRGVWGYAAGLLPMDKLITHRFPLEEVQKGMEALSDQPDGYIKGIVAP